MTENAATLGELLMHLRHELDAAQRDDPAHPARFGVDQIELETTVSVSRGQKGTTGLAFKVLSLGSERSRGDEATMRVKLQLTPTAHRSSMQDLRISEVDAEPVTSHGSPVGNGH